MSRPLGQFTEPVATAFRNTPVRRGAGNSYYETVVRAAILLLLFTGLAVLTGCQGFAAGGTGRQDSPGALAASLPSLAFGSITLGKNQSLPVTISNPGSTSITISQVGITGAGFTLVGITTPLTLAAGQSTSLTIKFAPTTTGTTNGKATISSNASNPTLAIGLSGTGTTVAGQLGITPTALAVGSVVDGSSGSTPGNLTASGANVTVTGATTDNSAFSIGGLSLPVTIAAGQSLPFSITFSPLTVGSASAMLTINSDAQPSTTTDILTGTGTAAPNHAVNLSWDASTSSGISGYNVYRAPYTGSCGSYVKINTLLNTTTLYTDSTVADGTSYCYGATSVNTSNQESGYSNIVTNVQIPPA